MPSHSTTPARSRPQPRPLTIASENSPITPCRPPTLCPPPATAARSPSRQPPTAAPTATPTATDDDAYYRTVLHALIDQGANLARLVHDRAAATPGTAPDQPPGPDPTVAFDRAARAVRRCIALARHIAQSPGRRRPALPRPAHRRPRPAHPRRRGRDPQEAPRAGRRRPLRRVQRTPGRPHPRARPPGPLVVEDVIEEICRDLGVAVQGRSWVWRRRTPGDLATLRDRAAAPLRPAPASTASPASPPPGSGGPARPGTPQHLMPDKP